MSTGSEEDALEAAKQNVVDIINLIQQEKDQLISERKMVENGLKDTQEKMRQVEKREKLIEVMHERVKQAAMVGAKIKLNIGGVTFTTSVSTLTREKDTFFSVMFGGNFNMKPDEDGEYFIDREGDLFHIILKHLRGYDIDEVTSKLSEIDKSRLAVEAEFYGITSMIKYLQRRPRKLHVKFTSKFGSNDSSDRRFLTPHVLAVDLYGNFYICDSDNNRIVVFDYNGNWKENFGSKGSLDGEFCNPGGIAFNSKGHLLVCDTNNARIQIFDKNMKHMRTIGTRGGRAGKFLNPVAIAIDYCDNIYIADAGNHRIQIFSPEGLLLRVIGSGFERHGLRNGGSEDGELNTPSSVAVGQNGWIYVSETCNNRIQVFTNDGKFLFKFGSFGSLEGQFNNPCSLSLSENGHLIVCDMGNRRIQVFDASNGNFLNTLHSSDIQRPCSVVIGKENSLIIGDCRDPSIKIFEML
jgi:DNA-binding beta-propeller fold protein YncE